MTMTGMTPVSADSPGTGPAGCAAWRERASVPAIVTVSRR